MIPNRYLWLLAAGLSGSIVGLNLHPDIRTWGQRVMFVFGGLACALFLAHPMAKHFGLVDPGEISALGFGIAIVWQTIIAKFSHLVNSVKIPIEKGEVKNDTD